MRKLTASVAAAVLGAVVISSTATASATVVPWWTAKKANAQLVALNPQFKASTPTVITRARCAGIGTARKISGAAYFTSFRCSVTWKTSDSLFPVLQHATLWTAASPYVAKVICTSSTGLAALKAGACMHSRTAPPPAPTVADATRDVGQALASLIGASSWDGTLTCTGKSEAYTCQFADASHTGTANVVYRWQTSRWVPAIQLVCVTNGQRGGCKP